MDILEFIPVGRSKAISRSALERSTGLSDRENRDLIEHARQHKVILNDCDGRGYWVADMADPEDAKRTLVFIQRQESRKRAIQKGIDTAYSYLGKVCHE